MLFCFKDTATTEIYTLSLHDALPIFQRRRRDGDVQAGGGAGGLLPQRRGRRGPVHPGGLGHDRDDVRDGPVREARLDRKSTRLNSSHANISYAVFCLKKKHRFITLLV